MDGGTMVMIYIGTDPGQSGATCMISHFDSIVTTVVFRHNRGTDVDLWNFIDSASKTNVDEDRIAVLEKVHSFPGQGVSSTFKFGMNYGMVKGFLVASGIPFIEVTPRTWMKHYGMTKSKKESKTDWKRRLKELAQHRFPGIKMTNDMADAMLIANYAKETYAKK